MPVGRRTLLGAGLAGVAATLTGCREPAAPAWVDSAATSAPSPTPARTTAAAPRAAAPTATAATTPARKAAVSPVTTVLEKYLKPTSDHPKHPGYAGAVALVVVDGKTTLHTAVGHAVRYKAGPVELPAAQRVVMRTDSIFDLASLTKVYTTILVLRLVDQGKVDLDAPVQSYLPDFTGTGKSAVTVAQLLAHTSALPVGAKVTGMSDNTARWKSVMSTPLVSGGTPGTTFRYSSVGLMVLGRLVEKLTGKTLDQALLEQVTRPLGLLDTTFKPLRRKRTSDMARLVATDARTSRGLLRGTVHDDVCNILGGVAGHAGLFGTAKDVAVIGQMLLNGGIHQGTRILSADVVAKMRTNVNKGKPAIDAERPNRTADHGLGVEMNQPWFMGKLASATAFGHTGFTGTSLLVVPARKMVVVLLTNRAHPNWSWSNPDVHRVAVANALV